MVVATVTPRGGGGVVWCVCSLDTHPELLGFVRPGDPPPTPAPRLALSNSFGFGGTNASLLFASWDQVIRTEDEMSSSVGESQSLLRFLSCSRRWGG
eukprot:COSAG01_NODE_17693_length_1131_cov_0.849806_2_plen_96_part_01